MKKKIANLLTCLLLVFLLGSCQPSSSEEVSSTEITSVPETVTITFEQYENCETVDTGGEFSGELMATSQLSYDYGHYLTYDEIDLFDSQIDYYVPTLEYGRFFFTRFYTSKDNPNTTNQIREMTLVEDFTLYFGIWG